MVRDQKYRIFGPSHIVPDVELIRSTLVSEIIQINENRERRAKEESYSKARGAVMKQYRSLPQPGWTTVLPPLEDFRRLSSMQMVVKQTNAAGMLEKHTLDPPLKQEVEHWVDNARNALGKVLGYPDWKSASESKIHVAERLNARFLCKKCQMVGKMSYKWGPGMDYKTTCQHSCPNIKRRRREKMVWSADNFVADAHVCDFLLSPAVP